MAAIAGGGIIGAAVELIKMKEKQGDKAMDRTHDSLNQQMKNTANAGSWTGTQSPVSRKEVVKEKTVETPAAPKEEEPKEKVPETKTDKEEPDSGPKIDPDAHDDEEDEEKPADRNYLKQALQSSSEAYDLEHAGSVMGKF